MGQSEWVRYYSTSSTHKSIYIYVTIDQDTQFPSICVCVCILIKFIYAKTNSSDEGERESELRTEQDRLLAYACMHMCLGESDSGLKERNKREREENTYTDQ